jgi:hypothetical protein
MATEDPANANAKGLAISKAATGIRIAILLCAPLSGANLHDVKGHSADAVEVRGVRTSTMLENNRIRAGEYLFAIFRQRSRACAKPCATGITSMNTAT